MKGKEKKVWIWGCGFLGKIGLKFLMLEGEDKWKIQGLIDNDIEKQTLSWYGYSIESFEKQKKRISADDWILCCCTIENYKIFQVKLKQNGFYKFFHFWDLNLKAMLFSQLEERYNGEIVSRCCSQQDFYNSSFQRFVNEMKLNPLMHRKHWEWVYIVQVLEKYDVLQKGKSGIGFAVGLEPLPSFFANKQIKILATDLSVMRENANEWINTKQNAGGNLEKLYKENICRKSDFQEFVQYRDVDMNQLPDDLGTFDFCWSSCAIEHVGSLEQSKQFLKNMLNVLKPGGIGVHTTEFNLISNEDTLIDGNSVIYRKKDIEEIQNWFNNRGHKMEVSFTRGSEKGDLFVDIPPFNAEPYHLNLQLDEYIVTSFAIIVQKAR